MSSRPPLLPGTRILGIDPGLHVTGYAVIEVATAGPVLCEAGVVGTMRHTASVHDLDAAMGYYQRPSPTRPRSSAIVRCHERIDYLLGQGYAACGTTWHMPMAKTFG